MGTERNTASNSSLLPVIRNTEQQKENTIGFLLKLEGTGVSCENTGGNNRGGFPVKRTKKAQETKPYQALLQRKRSR